MRKMLQGRLSFDVHHLIMKDTFYCVMLAALVFSTTETKPGVLRDTEVTECHFQGQTLKKGQTVTSNCTNCTCIGGAMNCNQMECHKDPECILYETMPGSCCPVCVEYGCNYNGIGYPRGARIPAPKCHFCFCPWKGGKKGNPVCSKVQCPSAHCVDGTVPVGKCCPACPNGSNCWMGDLLIARGEEIWISPCRSCACQQEVGNGYVELKAKCSWRFEQKTCPYGK